MRILTVIALCLLPVAGLAQDTRTQFEKGIDFIDAIVHTLRTADGRPACRVRATWPADYYGNVLTEFTCVVAHPANDGKLQLP